jgi:hypothetical protein
MGSLFPGHLKIILSPDKEVPCCRARMFVIVTIEAFELCPVKIYQHIFPPFSSRICFRITVSSVSRLMNPVYTIRCYFLKVRLNIIQSSTHSQQSTFFKGTWTTCLNFENSCILPGLYVFMILIIISLYDINRLFFVVGSKYVFCEVWT